MAVDTPTTAHPGPSPGRHGLTPAAARLATLFPDAATPTPTWWQRRRTAIVVVLVIALVASGVLAAQAFGASGASYVTATVATHDVDSVLNGVAVVEPVSQASVAFPAAGTVAAVDVKLGDSVTVGQPLASLDPQALQQSLHEKQATLAQAQLTLQKALAGESVGGIGTGSTGNGRGNGSSSSSSSSNESAAAADDATGTTVVLTAFTMPRSSSPDIAKAQQEVLAAQQQVDTAVHTATQALDSATTVCAAAGVGSGSPSTPTTAQLTACQTAMQQVLSAQSAVSAAQQQLVAASTALDTLLAHQASTTTTTPSTTPAGGGTRTGQSGSTSRSASGSSATTSSPSASDLAAYQKAVDAAATDVAVAEQAIAQATIVSPIAGTVQAVDLAVGDTVTAGSTTANIVVVGTGGFEVTTSVSVDQVPQAQVGQPATFLPDGSKRALTGKVASIALAPTTTTSGATSYHVVVGLDDPNAPLNNGSTGSVAIVTKSSRSALAVPTSAVTTVGTRHTVTVLDGGTPTRTLVQVGVVGDTWTEITGGVHAGQAVVLADRDEPLPGSATSSSNGSTSTNGPGGFTFPPGGATFGGGFGGGNQTGR